MTVCINLSAKRKLEKPGLHTKPGSTIGFVDDNSKSKDLRNIDPQKWKSACAEFHQRYNELSFPDG